MIGNPSSLAGTFYDAFHKNRKFWKTIHIAAPDTPNIKHDLEPGDPRYIRGGATGEWMESVLELKGEASASYQIRVLGEFPDEADDTLIPLKHIENAVDKLFKDIDQHEAEMGLDVARFGDDQTVAIVRRGNSVVELADHRKSDLMHTTGKTLETARAHGASIINVDEVGLGSGVVDRIRELNRSNEISNIKVVGVNGGNKAQDTEKFFNLRTQMFDGLRQRFADGEISIPNDPELISQLASITYIYNSRGQLQIETKTADPRLRPPKPRQSRRPGASFHRAQGTRTPNLDRHPRTNRTTPETPPPYPPPRMALNETSPFLRSKRGDASSEARRRGFIHPLTTASIPSKNSPLPRWERARERVTHPLKSNKPINA